MDENQIKLIKEHEYHKLLTSLNATECYIIMLWQGNKEIENLMIPSFKITPSEYYDLRKDFEEKFPEFMSEAKRQQPTDCSVM